MAENPHYKELLQVLNLRHPLILFVPQVGLSVADSPPLSYDSRVSYV
jgi:hypothetical protein